MEQSTGTRSETKHAEYELIRARHGTFTFGTIPDRIRWFGYGTLAVSAVVPLLWFLPDPVRTAYLPNALTETVLIIAPLMIATIVVFVAAGVGLALISRWRRQLAPVPEADAWRIVGIEDICSGLGTITGGLGLVVILLLSSAGYLGVETYEWLLNNGVHPYGSLGAHDPSVVMIGAAAIVAGVGLLMLSRDTRRRDERAG